MRLLEEGIDNGFVAAFESVLTLDGIGRHAISTSEPAHPMAKRFDFSDGGVPEPVEDEKATGPTRPGRGGRGRK